MRIIGLDVGFGYTKSVSATGPDAFPSVVGDWVGARPGQDLLPGQRRVDTVAWEGRQYVVGDAALRLTHRRFVMLSRGWLESPTFMVLVLNALRRQVPLSGATVGLVTGLPVADLDLHAEALKGRLVGAHKLRVLPTGEPWEVTVASAKVLPQPLGTVFAQVFDASGTISDPAVASAKVGVLDVGFRTSDYYTLDALDVVEAECLTRNTGMAELLLDLSRDVTRRWGIELDPHDLIEPALRGTLAVGDETLSLAPILTPLLDRHAEAVLGHAKMLWGDRAASLRRVWLTGGGSQIFGGRLRAAAHWRLVDNPMIQNAIGYYRFGLRSAS